MSSRETHTRTAAVVCADQPELADAVVDARDALQAAGVENPSASDIKETVWLARRLFHEWRTAVQEAADIIARRSVPPLPSPLFPKTPGK